VTSSFTGAKAKPVLDRNGFQQLLAAAYVLQRHNESLRTKDPRLDAAWIFSEIAETQSLVQAGDMDLASAARLITDRLRKITDAGGVSISLLEDGYLNRLAESGIPAGLPGGSISSNSLVATERLRNGRQFQSSEAQSDVRLDTAHCRELGIGSVLAVPIQRGDEIAGLLELRWSKVDGFHECDVRTCQLMAGLVTQLLEQETGSHNVSISLQAFPQLSSPDLPASPASNDGFYDVPNYDVPNTGELTLRSDDEAASSFPEDIAGPLATACRVCGRPFGKDEAFCGNCSMPRVAATRADGLQSKWASMWFMQQAQDTLQVQNVEAEFPRSKADGYDTGQSDSSPTTLARGKVDSQQTVPGRALPFSFDQGEHSAVPKESARGGTTGGITEDSSLPVSTGALGTFQPKHRNAADIGNLLRTFQSFRLRLRTRRKAAAMVLASFALLLILAVWGLWPSNPSSQLTWFESLLVELGLAEVPARAPGYVGNPDVRVWVDVHTALYYCPGSDLYGKTPGGRFSTQRAAQQDQFEPASRAACE